MRTILTLLIFAGILLAEDPTPKIKTSSVGTVANIQPYQLSSEEALRAEIANLKAQLAKLQIRFQYEMKVCSMPDVMRAELAEQETAAALQKSKEAAKPKDDGK